MTLTLADYPHPLVRLACARCGRAGQYRRETLIARYGADVALPTLRLIIAGCEHRDPVRDPCGAVYRDLAGGSRSDDQIQFRNHSESYRRGPL